MEYKNKPLDKLNQRNNKIMALHASCNLIQASTMWPENPYKIRPPWCLRQQSIAVVFIHHSVPEVQSILFRIHSHRQPIRDIQIGDIVAPIQIVFHRHWGPVHCNVIIVPSTYRGGPADRDGEEKQCKVVIKIISVGESKLQQANLSVPT